MNPRLPNGQPPDAAGAIDLGALKGNPRAQREQMLNQNMVENGLAYTCDCGELIEEDGVELIFAAERVVPTPQGPQLGLQLVKVIYHSRNCTMLESLIEQVKQDSDVMRIAVRALPSVEWIMSGIETTD